MTVEKGNRVRKGMAGKKCRERYFWGSTAWSVCMATTGWGLIYFNLLNIFKIHNLPTSLPLSSRSARYPHSARPFVICCTAQSTFLPISRFPALSPHFSRPFPSEACGQNRENNLCQFSRGRLWLRQGRNRKEPEGTGRSRKKKTLDIARFPSTIVLVGCTDAPMPLAASQNFQEKQSCFNLFLRRRSMPEPEPIRTARRSRLGRKSASCRL